MAKATEILYNFNIEYSRKDVYNAQKSMKNRKYLRESEEGEAVKEKKRIFLSLSRKKSNLLLFGILFFLAFSMLVFLSVYQTAKNNVSGIEETYGTSFRIQIYRDESKPEFWEEKTVEGLDAPLRVYTGPNIDGAMMDRITEEVPGITDYEAGRNWDVMLYEYELIPGYWNYEYFSSHDQELSFDPEETKNYMYITQCFPTRNSFRFEQFYNGTFRLAEGRHITPEDKFKCIISKALAEKNDLKIGDTLRIDGESLAVRAKTPIESLGTVEAEIVGLFDMTYQQSINQYTDEYDILENWIITDSETGYCLDRMYGEENHLYGGYFFVKNPEDIDEVMKEVKNLDWIDWQYYELRKDDSTYKDAIKPLDTVKKIMFVCVCVITTAGILLLFLVITHSMKKRVRETGILMSLGITGKEIKRQFLWEHLLLGIAAFLLASIVSFAITPIIGEQIYGAVHQEKEQKIYTEKEIEAAIARGEQSKVSEMAKNQKTGVEPPKALHTKVSVKTVVIVLFSMLLIIYFCVNGVMKKTLKLEPIRVLSMIE